MNLSFENIEPGAWLSFAGLLLVVYVLIAQSYWIEARDAYLMSKNERIKKIKRKEHVNNYKKSLIMSRLAVVGMTFCLLSGLLHSLGLYELIANYLLLIASFALLGFSLMLAMGFFIVKYDSPKKLLSDIQNEALADLRNIADFVDRADKGAP